jgi:hypothetical protein
MMLRGAGSQAQQRQRRYGKRIRGEMTLARTLRSLHKWLGLALGLQLLIWAVSGFYMVAVDIDFIHGDSLVRNEAPPLRAQDQVLGLPALIEKYPDLIGAQLSTLPGFTHPVYELTKDETRLTIDAVTGEVLSPMSAQSIEALASRYYAGNGRIARAELIETTPVEARGRRAPLWRVEFDDAFDTTLYLDPDNGRLVTRRHRWWRVYDAFWMLHLMDYGDERDDVNNKLLRVVASGAAIAALTGIGLLFFSFRRRRRNGSAAS